MLLEHKNAVIYGGGGAIGQAVAKGFAREGATVHLAGRTLRALDAVADEIRFDGGKAETAQLDALSEAQVDAHADAVVANFGSLDVSFNLIGLRDVQGIPLAEMPLELFEQPIMTATRTMFLTGRAAARHMIKQRSGVILYFGGDGGREPIRDYFIGGFQVALGVIETLRRQFASELGQYGVRVVTLHTGGIPETIPKDFEDRDDIVDMLAAPTLLHRTATLDDVANVASFVASDRASSITAAAINITCGAVAD